MEKIARRIFEHQPYSQFLGAKLTEIDAGNATITLDVVDHLKQQHGYVHGGVVSYLADNSIAFAGGLALAGDILMSEFKINYLRPARGPILVARAETIGCGKRQAVCVAKIYNVGEGEEELCAIAQGAATRPASTK